ncbi:Phycobilisome protein [Candidatus Electrothrix laxa]
MGTSQSNPGPGGESPLVPPWADDQPQESLPTPEPKRFKGFRQSLGSFVSSGDRNDLQRAIGHYARKATGGSGGAARRMGSVSKAGGSLFGTLNGIPAEPGEVRVNLDSLSGLPCELAISAITNALTPENGDSDKIRIAMNHALAEALDGVEIFDSQSITDDVIIDTMISYLSESVFLQIVSDAGKAWNKAETPIQAMRAETELQELIKVVVDKHMAPNPIRDSEIKLCEKTIAFLSYFYGTTIFIFELSS